MARFAAALFLSLLIGALAGIVVPGLLIWPHTGLGFLHWLENPGYYEWWPWPIFGGLIAGLSVLLARLLRS
jgi:hypothetical protein